MYINTPQECVNFTQSSRLGNPSRSGYRRIGLHWPKVLEERITGKQEPADSTGKQNNFSEY